MITISLCVIVRNEESVLGRMLDSAASIVDEIILVDTGSTDSTKEIALSRGCRVFDFPWCDDISLPPGTLPAPKHLWSTGCGWTQMM